MINSIYLLALIAPILTIAITKAYDKFEKKDYTKKVYIQIALMSYLTAVFLLYISTKYCSFLSNNSCSLESPGLTQSAGGQSVPCTASVNVPQPAPWSGYGGGTSETSSQPSSESPSMLGKMFKNIEKVVKSTTQLGGSSSGTSSSGQEVFHTGKPTF